MSGLDWYCVDAVNAVDVGEVVVRGHQVGEYLVNTQHEDT